MSARLGSAIYVTLQRRGSGDAGDTHVDAMVSGLRQADWSVRLVAPGEARSVVARTIAGLGAQLRVIPSLGRVDLLLSRMHPLAAPLLLAARWLRVHTVVEVNGVDQDYAVAHPGASFLRSLVRRLLQLQLSAADDVVVVTPGLASWVRTMVGDRQGVHVVPNAADPQAFRPGLKRPKDVPQQYVLYFGSLSAWQGIELCLDAAGTTTWPADVALVIVGDGPARAEAAEAARRTPERVVYLGSRAAEDVPPYVANALVTLAVKQYHDRSAGQSPLKVYESLSAGVPVVGTATHGMEIIDEQRAGILLREPTPAAVAHAVVALLADDGARSAMGMRGRHAVLAAHTWRHRANQLADIVAAVPRSSETRALRRSARRRS